MEFKYPVAPAEGKEYTAEELYGKLAQEDSGYYLLSANGFWHGGVHFSNKQFSEEMPVQAIADGTVIAYRINKNYPETLTSPSYKGCKYSTGFCLIKHSIPFKREKTAEEKQQEAQQQAQAKVADIKTDLEGKKIVVQNTGRNYRSEEGTSPQAIGQYPIGATLEVISINETPKEGYYFAKVKQVARTPKAGERVPAKETLVEGEYYIALLDKNGDIDKTSAGKAVYDISQATLAKTKAQVEGNKIVVQNTARNYRAEEGISPKTIGQYPIGATLEVISLNEVPKEDYYFAKVKQVSRTLNAGETTAEKETLVEGEYYIALLDKSGSIDKTKAGKPVYEILQTAVIETPATTDTLVSEETSADKTSSANTTETSTTSALPLTINLEFYSLYMHLSAYEDYLPPKEDANKEANEVEKPKQITIDAKYLRVRDKHRDEAGAKVLGQISNGAQLEIIETKESGNFTDVKAKLLQGSVPGSTVKIGDILWVPIKNGAEIYYKESNGNTNTSVVKEKTRPSYWEGKVTAIVKSAKGLTIWEKFEEGVLKAKIGDITQGSQFTFNSTEVQTIVHEMNTLLIAECTAIGNFNFRSTGEQPKGTFWTTVDKESITRTKVEPLVFDTLVPCNTKVIAGEPLGYLGTYETPNIDGEINAKKQVHVEIFTPNLATVEFLLNNPFKLTGRKYIKVPKGTVLKGEVPINSDVDFAKVLTVGKIDFPGIPSEPKQQDYGFGAGTIFAPTIISQPNFTDLKTPLFPITETLPANLTATNAETKHTETTTTSSEPTQETIPDYTTTQDHYFAVDKLTIVKDRRVKNKGTKIEIVEGNESYYEIGVEKHTGYLNKKGIEEIDQHEWAKLGFQLVQEANPNSDGYLDPNLMPAVFQQIYSKIDTNKDGKLQSEELKTALQNEEIRDQWSKLIAYHPSEWKLDTRPILARFIQLLTSPLATEDKLARAQALLANETQKMNTLTFLEQVVPPISPTPMLYHFHPVAFVDYLKNDQIAGYHIYHDGRIEKHIPSSDSSTSGVYQYIYHDKNGQQHNICTCEWHTAKKKKLGTANGTYTYPNHGTLLESKTIVNEDSIDSRAKYANGDIHEWIKELDGVSIYQRLTLINGDIAEYGKHDTLGYIWRLYVQQSEDTQLVRMPDCLNYTSNNVVIKYELKETFRKYTHPDILAGFIGALAEIQENIIVTGSAYEQGSCFPSALHVNGESIDSKYLKKVNGLASWEKDKIFVRALAKFHFKKFRIGTNMISEFSRISGCADGGGLHNSHLHSENFDSSAVKVIQNGVVNVIKLSKAGRDLLKGIESLRLKPYYDKTGEEIKSYVENATIGYGHLITQNEWDTYKNGLTQNEAETLFDNDIAPYENKVAATIKRSLKAHEFDALVIFAFNTGVPANFPTTSVAKLINDPNASTPYKTLDDAWKAWNKYQGEVMDGLVNRRAAELKIYHQGVYERW